MKKVIVYTCILLMFFSFELILTKELKIGNKAPEINLPNIKGEIISLYSMRNKVVLIDFWASWCAPCVNEQPIMAKLYKKYKNSNFSCGKSFEIYAVSLDNKKKPWKNIIDKYKINWTQVSDLKFWASPVAKIYNIDELPYNVLIDGKGIIIAMNLHGNELDSIMKKLLI